MALRNQPYIPMMVKDILTDEKLKECSPSTWGVYTVIMCVLHKQHEYGTLTVKEKNNIHSDVILNFSEMIKKHTHFTLDEIDSALKQLIDEEVVTIKGNKLIQKRMVRDNEISLTRANAAKGIKKDGTKAIPTKQGFDFTKNTAQPVEKQPFRKELADEKFEFFKAQEAWLNEVAYQFGQPLSGMTEKLRAFCKELNNKEILESKSDADFKTHFINWLRKQPDLKVKEEQIKARITFKP